MRSSRAEPSAVSAFDTLRTYLQARAVFTEDDFALVREVRTFASAKIRSLPAIAVTAYANPEDRVKALVAGYQNHVPKPVDANVLAAAIATLVGAR